MKELIIQKNDADGRFDKYLKKLLINASGGFIYKMLRKKNITLNDCKADGSEILKNGDHVKLFFSDETFEKFTANVDALSSEFSYYENLQVKVPEIIFENEDIIIANKPKNMLSQKAKPDDLSINEILIAYMIQNGLLTLEEYKTFHPSVCNRLDQNTTGLIIFGKTKKGLQEMSYALKNRTVHKYYYALVEGKIEGKERLSGYITKNQKNNTVSVSHRKEQGADYIETLYRSLSFNPKNNCSLLEIELITGKTHQIRAHLASIGHGIIGDYKYGSRKTNYFYKERYDVDSQLLHAYKIVMEDGQSFTAEVPLVFHKIMNGNQD